MIRLSKSSISQLEKKAVIQVLESEYLGMGEYVDKFERKLSIFFGRPVVCVSSGTSALHLSLQAIGLKPNDEVLVQSMTYVATFQAISATGAKPVSCDVNPDTLTIDCKDAKKRLTSNTRAIIPVHYAGDPGELDTIYNFAKEHNLRVIEDAAHAFGSKYKGSFVGSFGDIACFSFDGIKNITSGEGGCIVTNDKNVIKKVRDIRLLGVEEDTESRFLNKKSWKFDVCEQGWRYHMSNIMAAIGIKQLERSSELLAKRKNIAQKYDKLLEGATKLKPILHNYSNIVPHIYVVVLERGVNRDNLRQQLSSNGIETGVHYYPNHWLSLYRTKGVNIPVVESIYQRLLSLPLHPSLKESDLLYICNTLKRCLL